MYKFLYYFIVIIFINPQLCIAKDNRQKFLSEKLSNNIKLLSEDKISQDFISIENAGEDKFNLLQTLSSYQDLPYLDCEIIDRINYSSKKPEISNKFFFANRTYHFLNFSNLDRGHDYHLYCNKWEELIDKNIKIPKENSFTNLLAFGDWSEGELGSMSKNFMKPYIYLTDSILFLGDLAYDLHDDFGERGNSFMEFIKDFSSEIPFQLSVGNHEAPENFTHYQNRFYLPNRSENKTFYYSYDINNVHLVSLNSEAPYSSLFDEEYIQRMLEWLRNDLSSTKKKWKIAYMHRPLYCSKPSGDYINGVKKLKNLFEDIFLKYSVDLVIAGHRHNYERLYPIYNTTVDINSLRNLNNTYLNPKYPTYVICGATGNSEGMEPKVYPTLSYSKIVGNTIGICHLKITEEELIFKHLLSNNGTIFDEFNILKVNQPKE
jgi:hypothetical protein